MLNLADIPMIHPTEIHDRLNRKEIYLHSKSGNEYSKFGITKLVSLDQLDLEKVEFKVMACDSEDKETSVCLFYLKGQFYMVEGMANELTENKEAKVVYERNGTCWLRSEHAWSEKVEHNNQEVSRFVYQGVVQKD